MKAVVKYHYGNDDVKEGFKSIEEYLDRVCLYYETDEEIGGLTIPKSAIKEIRITDFQH